MARCKVWPAKSPKRTGCKIARHFGVMVIEQPVGDTVRGNPISNNPHIFAAKMVSVRTRIIRNPGCWNCNAPPDRHAEMFQGRASSQASRINENIMPAAVIKKTAPHDSLCFPAAMPHERSRIFSDKTGNTHGIKIQNEPAERSRAASAMLHRQAGAIRSSDPSSALGAAATKRWFPAHARLHRVQGRLRQRCVSDQRRTDRSCPNPVVKSSGFTVRLSLCRLSAEKHDLQAR